ncbi:MAG: hypothetical protein KGL39_38600 [Patescibacteria group bacterium]|nr:hypothetical protein [Patescibacteria group bacterium]
MSNEVGPGPSVEPGSQWSKGFGEAWNVQHIVMLNGELYANLTGPWSHKLNDFERAVVPVLTLIRDWNPR